MKIILPFLLLLTVSQSTISQDYSIIHDGLTRTYKLHLPAGYNPENTYPLVFSLHGVTSNGFQQELLSGFNSIADQENFIVVYPNGIDATWNIASPAGVDDVGFISALIDTLDYQYNIDLNRVFASGMSMGGFMCYRLACELSNRIAAIASVTGLHAFFPCNPPRPVPVMQIHGTADPVVPYAGVPSTISFWLEHNGCPQEPVTTDFPDINQEDNSTVTSYYYGPCSDSTEVILYSVTNGEHSWPGSFFILGVTNQDIDASMEIWHFFKKFDLQGSTGIDQAIGDETDGIKVFPNPAKGFFIIKLTGDFKDVPEFRLYDAKGQLVREIECNPGEEQHISCTGLTHGLYLAEFRSGEFRKTRKIIIY